MELKRKEKENSGEVGMWVNAPKEEGV